MTKTIAEDDKRSFSLMANYTQKLMDDFFVHQCIVRRFYEKNKELFDVNTPFLTQHHRRIIKPPVCTQQVSYH